MKIALFLPSLAGGGAEKVQVSLANSLAARGHEVSVIVGNDAGPAGRHLSAEVRLVDLKKPRVSRAVVALARHLRAKRPDVLLAALSHANIVAIVARRLAPFSGTRIVVSERAPIRARIGFNRSRINRALPCLIRLLYPLADRIICVSRGVAEEVREIAKLHSGDVGYIYNPVAPCAPSASGVDPAHRSLLDGFRGRVVLAAGRLTPAKDLGTLIAAFARVADAQRADLVILGEGPCRGDLEAGAAALGIAHKVHFLGFVDDPLAYMARADVFALSSRLEGLGNVLIEALSCGLPVVSTDCPYGPREVLGDGAFGRLVPVGDADALSEAILAAFKEPGDVSVLKKRAEDFSLVRITDRYEAVFRSLLAPAR